MEHRDDWVLPCAAAPNGHPAHNLTPVVVGAAGDS